MKKLLEYKGYHSKIEFDHDNYVLYGKIEGIDDLIIFESSDVSKIEEEFHLAVDDYLELCEEVGKEPEKEYKGSFNVRIAPELHKKLAIISLENGDNLNTSVEKAISEYISKSTHDVKDDIKVIVDYIKASSINNVANVSSKTQPSDFNIKYEYGEVIH